MATIYIQNNQIILFYTILYKAPTDALSSSPKENNTLHTCKFCITIQKQYTVTENRGKCKENLSAQSNIGNSSNSCTINGLFLFLTIHMIKGKVDSGQSMC